jgi:hypothetical protein
LASTVPPPFEYDRLNPKTRTLPEIVVLPRKKHQSEDKNTATHLAASRDDERRDETKPIAKPNRAAHSPILASENSIRPRLTFAQRRPGFHSTTSTL